MQIYDLLNCFQYYVLDAQPVNVFVLFFTAFNNQGTVLPYGGGWRGSKDKIGSPGSDKTGSFETEKSASYFRQGTDPSPTIMFAQSPPNMEGQVTVVAPSLAEDTLMDVCCI